ncbi:MAG: nucleotide exchange factor GrpE [Buchnera aphidicola (Nurudea shiraii)]
MSNDNENIQSKKNVKHHNSNIKKIENDNNQNYKLNDIHELNKRISDIKKSTMEIQLREQAEIENIKKETEKKIKKIQHTKLEFFCKNLIPILDDFKNIKNTVHALKIKNNKVIKGILLTLKLLSNTIEKFNLTAEKKINVEFNPLLHQTESNQNLNDTKNCYVSKIIKDGYIYHGKIIRKATVKIQKQ